jgi:hypothetical protein
MAFVALVYLPVAFAAVQKDFYYWTGHKILTSRMVITDGISEVHMHS